MVCFCGTEKSKGTKVFTLAGKINNVGLIEVTLWALLFDEIIYEIGGGIKNGKNLKSRPNRWSVWRLLSLTEKHLDTPIEYETLVAFGSMMGSGGMDSNG